MFTIERGSCTNKGDNPKFILKDLCPFLDLEYIVKKQLQPSLAPECGALVSSEFTGRYFVKNKLF